MCFVFNSTLLAYLTFIATVLTILLAVLLVVLALDLLCCFLPFFRINVTNVLLAIRHLIFTNQLVFAGLI